MELIKIKYFITSAIDLDNKNFIVNINNSLVDNFHFTYKAQLALLLTNEIFICFFFEDIKLHNMIFDSNTTKYLDNI